MPEHGVGSAGHVGSHRGLPGAVSREVTGSGGIAGWSSAATPSSTVPRLPVRYERRADIYEAFTLLQASLITLRQIRRFC